jgi:hypothetical protein
VKNEPIIKTIKGNVKWEIKAETGLLYKTIPRESGVLFSGLLYLKTMYRPCRIPGIPNKRLKTTLIQKSLSTFPFFR